MNTEQIKKIWIDNSNRLCIQPQTATFELIYRSAMGVNWNTSEHYLCPTSVGSWSSIDWFHQIISALENEYGYQLCITEKTQWENIDESLKQSIKMVNGNPQSL